MAATGTPTSGFKFNKKVLIHTGAGIAAAILIAFAITQCSSKNSERAARAQDQAAANNKMEQVNQNLIDARNTLERATGMLDSLATVNAVQADSIIVLNDSIAVLNDSLSNVNQRLQDCRNGKRRQGNGTRPTAPRPVVKPAPVNAGNTTTINLNTNSQNNGAITVANDGANVNNTNITLGEGAVNEGTIIVNNGGIVNHFQNAIDTLARAQGDTLAQKKKVPCQAIVVYSARQWKQR